MEKNTFDYLYEKYKKLLWRKAYDILKDYALAEDAVSEAFIRVYKHFDKLEDPDSSRTAAFLVTVVKNVAINLYHKRNKVLPTNFDEFEQASDFNLEETVAERDEASRAVRLIDKLSDELRAVFLLKFAHDLPHKEIGNILGISENNVTVRLHRAKKKLAELAKEVR
ncbi:MAG: sigma-70 family RNA polymerase sigma factor [Defluviitaleaceae bacterium]|nr:sigma-70 family RNA polymerase sigma factor [Defluviitaleaceae bacterium]MCL2262544.1 sigma-70 family RNA polymerase sigma factor [Defluviitaleaceae bacterium]